MAAVPDPGMLAAIKLALTETNLAITTANHKTVRAPSAYVAWVP